ncbi:YIP1 family protein [Meridianimarinicoccus sp. MJW13]|uniref:YIP1 family protein n=1 Tax=Meridianimarinicoccus sp. MJW13 TaxID=2720031 RepID=UPI00186836C3|nr:YIP1 family protein [Fluviibacterium sp. MJW13]
MAVTTDILATYRHPRQVLRRLLAGPAHEGRALAYLMLGCVLVFVAQWPRLSRQAALDPNHDMAELASGEVLVWIFMAPLAFYALAALAHLVARLLGGQGTWYRARMATFWTLVALSPFWLLRGMVSGFLGPGVALDAVTLVSLLVFALLWVATLREAERAEPVASDVAGS